MEMKEATVGAEMPQYKCHKKVWALKISKVERFNETDLDTEPDERAILTPANPKYVPFIVDHKFMRKHEPEVGGYYVVYDGGYESFSPEKVFEDGYTLIR